MGHDACDEAIMGKLQNCLRECDKFGLVYYVFHISLFLHVAKCRTLVGSTASD
jgi:hypothetical protein